MPNTIADRNTGHTFKDYLKRAVNPMLILLFLSQRPMYAYELEHKLASYNYSGSIPYQVLERLEKQGYVVRTTRTRSKENRVRQYYSITPSGLEHLHYLEQEYDRLIAAINLILASK